MRNFVVSLPSNCRDYSNSSQMSITIHNKNFYDNNLPLLNISPLSPQDALSFTVDLDAMAGTFKLKESPKAIKSSINLCIGSNFKKTSANTIKSKEYIKVESDYKLIKSLTYSKLGTFDSDIGIVDVYIVSRNSSCLPEHFRNKIYTVFHSVLSSNNISLNSTQFLRQKSLLNDDNENTTITGYLLNDDLKVVFNELYDNLKRENPVIFIETFGNKKDTMLKIENSHSIVKRLQNVIPNNFFNKLKIDVCISVSAGKSMITLANTMFFNTLRVDPNYQLFMSNAFLNLNKCTVNIKSGERSSIGRRLKTDKINFYSTIKRVFTSDSRTTYKTPCSFSLLTSNLYQHLLTGNSSLKTKEHYHDKFLNEYAQLISKEFPFRLEFRCDPLELDSLIHSVRPYLIRSNFSAIDSNTCVQFITNNVKTFNDIILSGLSQNCSNYNPLNLSYSIITEIILLNIYVKGQVQIPMINKDLRHIMSYDDLNDFPCIRMIDVERLIKEIEYKFMDMDIKKTLINDLVKYNSFSRINAKNEHMKALFSKLIAMYFSHGSLDERIKKLMKIYISLFNQNSSTTLIELKSFICDSQKPANINLILKDTFIKRDSMKRSNLLHLGFSMIKNIYDISEDNLINALVSYAKDNEIRSLYNPKTQGKTKVNVDYMDDHLSFIINDRKNIFDQFITNLPKVDSMIKPGTDELIRFVNAMFMYRHSQRRHLDIFNDFSYGFFLVRSVSWIKNRMSFINKIAQHENTFRSFMQRVRSWNPTVFSSELRNSYLFNSTIQIPKEKIKLYESLVECDSNIWMLNFGNVFEDNEYHDIEIFTSSIPIAKKNELDLNIMYSWYNKNPFFNEPILTDDLMSLQSCNVRSEMSEVVQTESIVSFNSITHDQSSIHHILDESRISDIETFHNSIKDSYTIPQATNFSEVSSQINESFHADSFQESIWYQDEQLFEIDNKISSQIFQSSILSDTIYSEDKSIEKLYANSCKRRMVKQKIIVPTPASIVDKELSTNDSSLETERNKIFRIYEYNTFCQSQANKIIYHSTARVPTIQWNIIIQELLQQNHISQIGCRYKMNMKRKDGNFLTFEEVLNNMKALYKKFNMFSLNLLRHSFRNNKRPDTSDMKIYIDSLIKEKLVLPVELLEGKTKSRSIKYRLA